jgi:hypothetical protein
VRVIYFHFVISSYPVNRYCICCLFKVLQSSVGPWPHFRFLKPIQSVTGLRGLEITFPPHDPSDAG